MNDLFLMVSLFSFAFWSYDNVPLGIGLGSDSTIFIENYNNNGTIEIDLDFEVYVNYGLYETINYVVSFEEVPFYRVSDIIINFIQIGVSNNYFYFEFDIDIYTDLATLFWSASQYYEINLYEDYVFENDLDLGACHFDLYDVSNYDLFYNYGYDEGYEEGKTEGQFLNNVISWFGSIWDSLKNLFSLEIAPNVSLGLVFGIPVFVGLLWFLLRALIN